MDEDGYYPDKFRDAYFFCKLQAAFCHCTIEGFDKST